MALDSVSLSGDWQFRAGDQAGWQSLAVPGCWERLDIPHDWEGPGWYRKTVEIPVTWRTRSDERLWLRFGAVSYACTVWVNAVEIGTHLGAWDAFTLEITQAVAAATRAEILVRVVKPGGPTYPTNQTTAGFLPYVWGFLFGGIWQDVTLERTGPLRLPDFHEPTVRSAYIPRESSNYPRMALSWGWYPDTLHCNPPVEVMRTELENLRALGYNGVKCCLWVPPPAYLDLCDALGMLVWMELPLWLPQMDAAQLEQVYREYEAIVSQVCHHPCIVIWSLGCELSASCPVDFMKRLYGRIRELTVGDLLRDNSGGGECYGGALIENADYYDYHFYCDLPFLRTTFDYFLPRWRPDQPWFFGEFCDADAYRDLPALREAHGGELPWWAQNDPQSNPQGVRWDMNIIGQWAALEQNDLLPRLEELKEGQRRQTLLHRKYTVELVRTYREMSGYVITGLRDTPISTAGMFDDFGAFRYTPEEFTRFNADTVLFLGWHRRRNWVAGGDRPSYIDHWTHVGGETLLPRIGISHSGKPLRILSGQIELQGVEGKPLAQQPLLLRLQSIPDGVVMQIAEAEIELPQVSQMTQALLRVTLRLRGKRTVQNEWPLWIVPRTDWNALPAWVAFDPDARLQGLERYGATCTHVRPEEIVTLPITTRLVASRWIPEITAFVRAGGHAFVFVDSGGGLPTESCPFWREAMKLFDPHPLWDLFPHTGFTDIHFFGLGPDCALQPTALATLLPDAEWQPLLRRVDARTCAMTDYLTEAGFPTGGRLLFSTLRLHGGLGDQPDSLLRHTTGRHLLASILLTL
ncbi:MAG: glycoside hydrolase family 2, sugar binding [Chthonomonadales bacterium]|nr:glycoside hydrolase family 2, sugar binding [Chthonomonadales bacterium]